MEDRDSKPPASTELSAEDRELLAYLLEREGVGPTATQALTRRPDPSVRPLSFAQERMWFLHAIEPGSPLYGIPAALRLAGPLDVDALRRALRAVVERHEVLRTTFALVDGRPKPVVSTGKDFTLALEDLGGLPGEEREAELARRVRREAKTLFDLERGPLVRATLVRLGEGEHALLLAMHHVVSDAWSLGVLVRELGALYTAFAEGRPSPLPELAVQYADFAAWQREWLRGEVLEAQLAYWKRQLRGAPQVLELPTDHPRPAVQSHRGSALRHTMSTALLEELNRLARREGVTLFMVLLAAFEALLWRYSGQTDLVVGSPIANRTRREVEGLIGFFVNTLVLRTDVSGDPTFRELLGRVKEVALGAYAHQDLPFEKLVEELRPERALSHSPLFQVVFNLQNAPFEPLRLPGLTVTILETATGTAKFDLALYLTAAPFGLRTNCEYNADLFEASTIERMVGHYEGLLREVVKEPGARLSELSLLGEGERRRILVDWNATSVGYPERGIGEVFEEVARARPEALAVVHGAERLSYGELEARSNQVARYLRKRGVGQETRVGICMERSLELVVGLLGIVKAGGAYVPLDPEYPRERLEFMVRDADVSVLLTQERLSGRVEGCGAEVVCLDRDWVRVAEEGSGRVRSGAGPEHLAYVTYTSGSTGVPKGVEVRHRGVLRLLFGVDYAEFGPEEVFLQLAPVSFDASTLEVWGPLLHGGKCVLFPGRVPAPRELGEVLRREGVTTLWLTASLYNAVVEESAEVLEGLKQLLIGGEALSVPHVKKGYERLGRTRIINGYGPTEGTTFTCCYPIPRDLGEVKSIPIGRPIGNTRVYVLDVGMEPVPVGVAGELFIGGDGLGRGYLKRPELTAEKFVPDPFGGEPGGRLYRTGDLARYLGDGRIEYLGRLDEQVKVRGYRIELGEIEAVLMGHGRVKQCAVVVREDAPGDKRLVGYVVWREGEGGSVGELREHLRAKLPEHMVPGALVALDELPLTPNGKVDRRALPAPEGRGETAYVEPVGEVERAVAGVWREVLRVEKVGLDDNFFDLGGHSLLLLQVHSRLKERYPERELSVVDLFRYPTVRSVSEHLGPGKAASSLTRVTQRAQQQRELRREPIAVVGMAGRFPRARNVEEYWENLRAGMECVSFFTDEELLAAGVSPNLLKDPSYVRGRAVLEDVELFDAEFFGYTPREAEVMDPQQRIFLECAWEALENAGHDGASDPGLIGVYAGVSMNRYLSQLATRPELLEAVGGLTLLMSSDKDFLPTRVSYKLNLRGPSFSVQTACSTSLVAVHLACQGLWSRECDMALAGGVSVGVPQKTGYRYQPEGILSPDGHCRAFDAKAAGTVGGSGVGVVVLKRLAEALRDGDTIHAVIKGSAVNNDGSLKVGYTAPSVQGQAAVIAAAQAVAGVESRSVTYVEAHGTGTTLGDPIEVEALTQVFRAGTEERGFCALGSVKTNIGHLDAAAGVAGLMKAVLALEHREIPASLNYEEANPKIGFEASPFYVNTRLREWESEGPRRAGVSSFGIGGTNAHVVLEESPEVEASDPARGYQLLVLSGRTEKALGRVGEDLRRHLEQRPGLNLADVAHTLRVGRRGFAHRRVLVARDVAEAVLALGDAGRGESAVAERTEGRVAFLFPGQGAQYPGMGEGLYREGGVFREVVDGCAEHLRGLLGLDLREVLYPGESGGGRLSETALTQPALFVTEYALARQWMSWGIEPVAMVGHSVGEFVAAALAGVFTLEEALELVAERGRLMQAMPRGSMAAVPLGESELVPLLGEDLSLAAVNGPGLCVVSGPTAAVEGLEEELGRRGVMGQRLVTSHAFHSSMMEPVLGRFRERVARAKPRPPKLRVVSNVTGGWLTGEQASDPGYWSSQLRRCVRFGDGVRHLLGEVEGAALLEVGPGRTLTTLVRQQGEASRGVVAVTSLRHPKETQEDRAVLLRAVGRLWLSGVKLDWARLVAGESRRRVPLPTYPFERQRYWVEPGLRRASGTTLAKSVDPASWFYLPSWKSSVPEHFGAPDRAAAGDSPWLVFGGGTGAGEQLAARLRRAGKPLTLVRAGDRWERRSEDDFTIRPEAPEDYRALLDALEGPDRTPRIVVHAWTAAPLDGAACGIDAFAREQARGFYSLLFLIQALARPRGGERVRLVVVSSHLHDVTGAEVVSAERQPVLGLCKVGPQEVPKLACCSVDVALSAGGVLDADTLELLEEECAGSESGAVVALRNGRRWVQAFQKVALSRPSRERRRLREEGTYLITGGLGEIGLEVAEHLARTVRARLVLLGRNGLPGRAEWDRYLASRGEAEATSRKILRVRALEALGAEVLAARADVADEERMREVCAEAEARFGAIHGVIHAAGTTHGPTFAGLADLGRDECEEQFRSKVGGLYVLDDVLRGRRLDFRLLMSSLSSVLGGLGMGAYASANAFMDGFAVSRSRSREAWTSVNWDGWRLYGETGGPGGGATVAALALSRAEGIEVLERLLGARPVPQVVVSAGDLETRLEQWVTRASVEAPPSLAREVSSAHARPALTAGFVAPRDETERTIAGIWEALLGVQPVGVQDDFFELGGHSLLATQVISRFRDAFGVDVPLRVLFEAPTVAGLAERVTAAGSERGQAERVAEVVQRLKSMSTDERRALLEREKLARDRA